MKSYTKGFTLTELLVVISILAILSSFLFVNFNEARQQSRDAERKSDLRNLQAAIELYKQDNGEYPRGCNDPTTLLGNIVWSGQTGSGYECDSGSDQYIEGLAPKYISTLPTDPRLNDDEPESGYVYAYNDSRTVYKVMALNTVESETVNDDHDFYRCVSNFNETSVMGFAAQPWNDASMCVRISSSIVDCGLGSVNPPVCTAGGSELTQTYSLSGGFSTDDRGLNSCPDKGRSFDTKIVRCY